MAKRQLTPQEQYPILKSVQIIGVLSHLIQIEYQSRLVDVRFKQPAVNNNARKIKEAAEQIQKDLAFQFKLKDREQMQYEHSIELWRVFDHFAELTTEQIREFMDGVDKVKQAV